MRRSSFASFSLKANFSEMLVSKANRFVKIEDRVSFAFECIDPARDRGFWWRCAAVGLFDLKYFFNPVRWRVSQYDNFCHKAKLKDQCPGLKSKLNDQ